MTLIKYSPETIERLSSIITNEEIVKPSVHLNNLFRTVTLGMYDSLRESAKQISSMEAKYSKTQKMENLNNKANTLLKELYETIKIDIAEFSELCIEDKMSSITQSRFLDIDPKTYATNESLMIMDKDSVEMSYIYLTQPLRKKFRDKHKPIILRLDNLVNEAKKLT